MKPPRDRGVQGYFIKTRRRPTAAAILEAGIRAFDRVQAGRCPIRTRSTFPRVRGSVPTEAHVGRPAPRLDLRNQRAPMAELKQ
jgi:hypothetical protein